MEYVPTEVARLSLVAGYGPPCTMAWQTSTPVGKPLTMSRPALRLEKVDEVGVCGEIGFRGVQRRRQLAFETAGEGEHFFFAFVADDERGGAEDFCGELGLADEVCAADLKDDRCGAAGRGLPDGLNASL